jgi:hypothetical protein
MTTRDERNGAKLNRDEYAERLARLGHDVKWNLAPHATRRGHAYFFEGLCRNCHGTISVASSWTSCSGIVDLRADSRCAGPGTHILTDIEAARASELIAPAIAEFTAAVRAVTAALN